MYARTCEHAQHTPGKQGGVVWCKGVHGHTNKIDTRAQKAWMQQRCGCYYTTTNQNFRQGPWCVLDDGQDQGVRLIKITNAHMGGRAMRTQLFSSQLN